jgi:hypothetical protein
MISADSHVHPLAAVETGVTIKTNAKVLTDLATNPVN